MKSLIATLVLTLATSTAAHAGSKIPQIYPKCSLDVAAPEGATGHYFNEDCTEVFVLPKSRQRFEVHIVSLPSAGGLCETRDLYREKSQEIKTMMAGIKLDSGAKDFEINVKKFELLQDMLESLEENLYHHVGQATVLFHPAETAALAEEYARYNVSLLNKGVRFSPAPVIGSETIFSPLVTEPKGELYVTGMAVFGETFMGTLSISMDRVCDPEFMQDPRKNAEKLLTANVAYGVPVMDANGKVEVRMHTAIYMPGE